MNLASTQYPSLMYHLLPQFSPLFPNFAKVLPLLFPTCDGENSWLIVIERAVRIQTFCFLLPTKVCSSPSSATSGGSAVSSSVSENLNTSVTAPQPGSASFDVASGRVIHSSVGDTRTEADYLSHVQSTVATAPETVKWHLVMDCLNTHQSESLVRYVAQVEALDIELGIKGKSGILQSMATRTAFLIDPTIELSFTSPPSIALGSIKSKFGLAS